MHWGGFLSYVCGLLYSFPVFSMINTMVNSIENWYKKELRDADPIELKSNVLMDTGCKVIGELRVKK